MKMLEFTGTPENPTTFLRCPKLKNNLALFETLKWKSSNSTNIKMRVFVCYYFTQKCYYKLGLWRQQNPWFHPHETYVGEIAGLSQLNYLSIIGHSCGKLLPSSYDCIVIFYVLSKLDRYALTIDGQMYNKIPCGRMFKT